MAGRARPGRGGPRRWLDDVRHRRLAITGDDLVAAGLSGPAVGDALEAAQLAALRGEAAGATSSSPPGWPPCGRRSIAAWTARSSRRRSAGTATTSPPSCRAPARCSPPAAAASRRAPFDSLNLGRLTDDDGANVDENRERLAAAVGLPRERFLYGRQVHGSQRPARHRAAERRPGRRPTRTARRPRCPTPAALVFIADCLPIVLAADEAVAALHGGWRGLAAGIIAEGVAALRELGADGPGDRRDRPGRPRLLLRGRRGGPRALRGHPTHATGEPTSTSPPSRAHKLAEAGVEEVHDVGLCTICRIDLFFSHRADGGDDRPPGGGRVARLITRPRRRPRARERRPRSASEIGGRGAARRRQVRPARGARDARRGRRHAARREPRAGPRGQGRRPSRRVPLALHRPAPEPQGQGAPPARGADPLRRLATPRCASSSSHGTPETEILVEVNVAGEEDKAGIAPGRAGRLHRRAARSASPA